MTVLSRGARVRRGGRRPGWVLLTTLLVLAIGASSALVFTNRVELLKLAVILALWAAVAGAFVSVLYRRQAEADQSRARDMKLVYDLQLDREISARREYELTVESQLRRELAAEIRAQAADEIAALRTELASLRTHLEILFDADFEHRPALETPVRSAPRALQNGGSEPADWVASDWVTSVGRDDQGSARADSRAEARADIRVEEDAIIDVPEEPLAPPRQSVPVQEFVPPPAPQQPPPRHRPPPAPPFQPSMQPAAPPPQPQFQQQPPPPPEPAPAAWQPTSAAGQWLPPGTPGSHWAAADAPPPPADQPPGEPGRRRRRYRPEEEVEGTVPQAEPEYGGRRSRSRHSAEYRDYGVGSLSRSSPPEEPPPVSPPPSPRLAPAPAPAPSRHRGADEANEPRAEDEPPSGGQTVADLMARLQVQPGGGRRRRRDG